MDPVQPPVDPAGAMTPPHLPAVSHDFWAILMGAHWVVQAVMLVLALAGFLVLTILIHKTVELTIARKRLSWALAKLHLVSSLPELTASLADQRGPAPAMARLAQTELQLATDEPALQRGADERTRAGLLRIEADVLRQLRAGIAILATIGAIAPFVGLFGTVFGIMNSFLAIAETKTTNLAVVAPGIAEALFATAIGLVAAIPAVLVYNMLTRRMADYRQRLGDLATGIERLQSLALDRLAFDRMAGG